MNTVSGKYCQSLSLISTNLLLAALVFLSACGGGGGWQMPPPVVETKTAVQRPWTMTYSTTGTLEAANKVDLNTETPAVISRIMVQEGDFVQRGQVLIQLAADKQQAQVQQSKAGIEVSENTVAQQQAAIQQAQARLISAKKRLDLSQFELDRFEKLYKDQLISQLELEQRRTAYDTALATFQEAQQFLTSSQAQAAEAASSLAQARAGYRYNMALNRETVIRAPFSGVIGQKYVDPGDYVAPTEKLITVVDPSFFRIQLNVPERYLDRLRRGMPVKVTFEGLGNASFPGKVDFIDPVVDSDTRTVMVKALLPAKKGLRHNMFGTVALSLGTLPDAVVVPEEAIMPQGDKTLVYVVRREVYHPTEVPGAKKDKKKAAAAEPPAKLMPVAHLREVTVGNREPGFVQVSAGLVPGEEVIVAGQQKVNDNIPVTLKSELPPPESAADSAH